MAHITKYEKNDSQFEHVNTKANMIDSIITNLHKCQPSRVKANQDLEPI